MEYLQGRALTNAIGNLGASGAYADALNKLGHELEEIVEQVLYLLGQSSHSCQSLGRLNIGEVLQ